MNQPRIDVVTRTLSRLPSRRDVLRGLAAAGLGLGTLRLVDASNDAAAKTCKKIKDKRKRKRCLRKEGCPAGKRACKGVCIPRGACCSHSECAHLSTPCTNGSCNASHQCVPVPNNHCQEGFECLVDGRCAESCEVVDCGTSICECGTTKEGGSHCRNVVGGTCPVQTCTSTNDCFQGQLCQDVPGCGDRCVTICGAQRRSQASLANRRT